jgi:hypothetical protein
MTRCARFLVVFLSLIVLGVFALAGTRIGGSYRIPAESVDSGGGNASSVQYRLVQSCAGQATPPGRGASASYTNRAGIGECLTNAKTSVLKWNRY